MKRNRALSLTLSLLMMTTLAYGASVHLKGHRTPTFTDLGLLLQAIGALAGLGNGDVLIVLSATANAATTCTNQGGNQAPGQNPGDITVAGTQTIPASEVKNGNVSFDVTTLEPEQPTWDQAGCANPNWSAAIEDLDFFSATLRVYQNNVLVFEQTFPL